MVSVSVVGEQLGRPPIKAPVGLQDSDTFFRALFVGSLLGF